MEAAVEISDEPRTNPSPEVTAIVQLLHQHALIVRRELRKQSIG